MESSTSTKMIVQKVPRCELPGYTHWRPDDSIRIDSQRERYLSGLRHDEAPDNVHESVIGADLRGTIRLAAKKEGGTFAPESLLPPGAVNTTLHLLPQVINKNQMNRIMSDVRIKTKYPGVQYLGTNTSAAILLTMRVLQTGGHAIIRCTRPDIPANASAIMILASRCDETTLVRAPSDEIFIVAYGYLGVGHCVHAIERLVEANAPWSTSAFLRADYASIEDFMRRVYIARIAHYKRLRSIEKKIKESITDDKVMSVEDAVREAMK